MLAQREDRWLITNDKNKGARSGPKMSTLWRIAQTLLAHSCWRAFPALSVRLPELLLGGSFAGVRLQTDDFAEPAVGGSPGAAAYENKWDGSRRRRSERFEEALYAIDRLIAWAKDERIEFAERVMGGQGRHMPMRRKRSTVAQPVGAAGKSLPYVPDLLELNHVNVEAQPSNRHVGCSRARPTQPLACLSRREESHCFSTVCV